MLGFDKHKTSLLKIGILIITTFLALRFFLSISTPYSPPPPPPTTTYQPLPVSFSNLSHSSTIIPLPSDKCDLFSGEWIRNPAGPAYTNETCRFIEEHQNCMKNGRPDSEYLYWSWSPKSCELPQFNAMRFLEMMQNKTWAFIGDSISRNHVQSLICMLTQVEAADMFYHDEGYKSKGWHFPSHNLTIYGIWSPFLTEANIYEDINGVASQDLELRLDRLDKKWTDVYNDMDYMVFSTGKWFQKSAIYYENETILGCHICQKNYTKLDLEFGYHKTLGLALNFIANSDHKGLIFLRTSTPDHFEGGEWSTGGKCNRTVPFKEGEGEISDLQKTLRQVELEEFDKAAARASENGVRLKLLDFTQLSLLRPDGHPGPYRHYHPFAEDVNAQVQYDCLHWCLPGPIDAWNDVIMEILMNE